MERRQEQGLYPGDVNLETVRTWTLWQTEVERRMGAQCARREVRWRAWASIRGLLSPVERKNGWQIAEVNGETTPYGVQHVLGRLSGMPMPSATMCAPTWSSIWVPLKPCWSSMRRDCSKKASMRLGWHANRAGQQAALNIATWGCSCPLRVPVAPSCWTGTLSAQRVDKRRGALRGRGDSGGADRCDQAAVSAAEAGARLRRARPGLLGGGGQRLGGESGTAGMVGGTRPR